MHTNIATLIHALIFLLLFFLIKTEKLQIYKTKAIASKEIQM